MAMKPSPSTTIERATVIGAGTIGSSWAALFIANGIRTIVYDVDITAERKCEEYVSSALTVLQRISRYSHDPGNLSAKLSLLSFTTDLANAVSAADVVQENTPENLEIKVSLLKSIEPHLKPSALILSSTSTIPPSSMVPGLTTHAPNFLVGHPFNPPHLIPLVEVVPSPQTSQSSLDRTMSFYESLGKSPVHIRVEIPGHIANRVQAAVMREMLFLLQEGVATVADIDKAVMYGPGLRWGVMGPSALLHLGGGRDGARGFADKIIPALLPITEQGKLRPDGSLLDRWVEETVEMAGGQGWESIRMLQQRRDEMLVDLLNIQNKELGKDRN